MRWLKLKILQRTKQHRGWMRAWLARHPRISRVLERGGSLNIDEYSLARGTALGLFISLTPTVGIQTLLMIIGSLIFRANFPLAFVVSFVSNPLTVAPLYYGFSRLGELLLALLPIARTPAADLGGEIAEEVLAMLLGSMVIAIPAGLSGYFGFLWLWRKLDLHLPTRRAE
jgi:uncharacterized protein (DUF2062 family)